jgi:hypothetical protein
MLRLPVNPMIREVPERVIFAKIALFLNKSFKTVWTNASAGKVQL